MSEAIPVIAIDGPSGSGKGTVARRVAQVLGFHLLDSGALYRLVGLAGAQVGLSPGAPEHADVAASMAVRFGVGDQGQEQVFLGDQEVSQQIRTEEVGNLASHVASDPRVRAALTERQRAFVEAPGLVADGRDMGTVLFPDARLKIFLTASAEARALRRYNQLKDKGVDVNLIGLSQEIAERDARDATRAVAPLVAAADAISIDSTMLTAEEVITRVLTLARARLTDR
jgi:cytidylate kinase